uniref:Uncharacterized protein n=1 Tax=Trichogramma kaykai TaxID=54128 RepID=A0ABD2XB72_9HYME
MTTTTTTTTTTTCTKRIYTDVNPDALRNDLFRCAMCAHGEQQLRVRPRTHVKSMNSQARSASAHECRAYSIYKVPRHLLLAIQYIEVHTQCKQTTAYICNSHALFVFAPPSSSSCSSTWSA